MHTQGRQGVQHASGEKKVQVHWKTEKGISRFFHYLQETTERVSHMATTLFKPFYFNY
jgi:hypothetical protein